MRWLNSITNSVDVHLSKLWKIVKDRGAWHDVTMGSQRVRYDLATEQQQQSSDLYKNEEVTGWDWLNIHSMMRIYACIHKNYKRLRIRFSLFAMPLH